MKNTKNKRGFTLIEFLMTMALMAILAVLVVNQVSTTMNEARFDETVRRMREIRKAMVGDPSAVVGGKRTSFGYLGDVGGLPPTLDALTTNPGVPAAGWAMDPVNRIGLGWNGPYLKVDDTGVDYTNDAWGTAFVYNAAAGTVVSFGANGVGGGTGYNQTITMQMPANMTTATVYGVILSGGLLFNGDANVVLNYPNGAGVLTTQPTSLATVRGAANNNGAFSFANVPLGVRSVSIFIPPAAATPTIGPVIFTVDRAAVLIPTDQTNF